MKLPSCPPPSKRGVRSRYHAEKNARRIAFRRFGELDAETRAACLMLDIRLKAHHWPRHPIAPPRDRVAAEETEGVATVMDTVECWGYLWPAALFSR